MTFPRQLVTREYPIFLLLLLVLTAGLLTFKQYGEGWDEGANRDTARLNRIFYLQLLHPSPGFTAEQVFAPYDSLKPQYHGPAYYLLANGLIVLIKWMAPGWAMVDYWHLVYLLTFLPGLGAVYRLARRLAAPWAACAATALLASQPLIWGHVFINMKDTPFLTVFALTVVLGLEAADSFAAGRKPNWLWLAAAGVCLGFGASMRLAAPLAGLLVVIYFFSVHGWRSWLPLALLTLAAGLSMFASWPFLWENPVANLVEAVRGMSAYPWDGAALFNGSFFVKGENLPSGYLPWLLLITLTETAWLLILPGLAWSLRRAAVHKSSRSYLAVLLAWFWAPFLYVLLFHPVMYDNYRHFLFILPPLFILSGGIFDSLFHLLRRLPLQAGLVVLALLPGIYSSANLHPYEYTYYNSLVGGVGGAFRRFEADYWLTCYREVMDFLNSTAPQNASILVLHEPHIPRDFGRPDFRIINDPSELTRGSYILLSTRYNDDLNQFSEYPTLRTVGRAGAEYCVLRQVPR
jgi:4-amino-4-deoxy-L-arabinose transferase-like glycosyltransferase